MNQTRTMSMVETCTSVAIGFGLSMVITAIVWPLKGWTVTLLDNIQVTTIFTVASLVRGYFVRRAFQRLGEGRA